MPRGQVRPHGAGKWRVFVYVGIDPITGVEKRTTKVVKGTKDDAERKLTEILAELDAGVDKASGEHTLGFAIDAFLALKSLSLAKTSMDNYRSQASYVTETLRAMPLTKIGVEHLELFYGHLATKGHKRTGLGLEAKAVHNVHIFLHGVLEMARRRKWIAVNPAGDAERPKVGRRKKTPAASDCLVQLFAAATPATGHGRRRLATAIRVGITGGGRRSEICGLRWKSVDFDASRIAITEVVVVVAGEGAVVKPSTKSDEDRYVCLGAGTMADLQALHDEVAVLAMSEGVAFDPDWFVFSDDPLGATHWHPATFLRRFQAACETAGMNPKTRVQDLRQLMATHLADQGLPLPALAGRLGHTEQSTSLDWYVGQVPETDRTAAAIMDRLIDGP